MTNTVRHCATCLALKAIHKPLDSTEIPTTVFPLGFPSSSLGIALALLLAFKGLAEYARNSIIVGAAHLPACLGREPVE